MNNNEDIDYIRKNIRLLEWDLNFVKNEEMLAHKKSKLQTLRSELISLEAGLF